MITYKVPANKKFDGKPSDFFIKGVRYIAGKR